MTIWPAVVIGLGSGLFGTLVTISHERGAEFRTRQLTASEDFLRSAEKMRRALRRPLTSDVVEALNLIRDASEELVAPIMRVGLLYGPTSEANVLAEAVGGFMSRADDALQALAAGDQVAGERASQESVMRPMRWRRLP